MSPKRELPDADCKNCYYKLGSYAESTYQWCYMFKESPGNKCGQFRTINITPLKHAVEVRNEY
jgi:hypothetical protein